MMLTGNQIRVEQALRSLLSSGVWSRGDRLPSYAELANRLQTSVSVLQAIMPRLASDGIIEVVPRVGTFLRRVPGSSAGGAVSQVLRFAITESPNGTSSGWRAVASRFEQLNPGLEISFTFGLSSDSLLTKPDIILLQHEQARSLRREANWLPWADASVWKADERVDFVRAIWQAEQPLWGMPVLLGMPIMYAGPAAQGEDPSDLPSLVRGWRQAPLETYGFIAGSVMEPLWSLGLGDSGLSPQDERLGAWLHVLATIPPPAMVTITDFVNNDLATVLEPLIKGHCRYFLGSLWMSRVIERNLWRLRLPTTSGALRYGVMSVVVPEGPRAETAASFARFIAGPEGQGILGERDSLLPTLREASCGHPFGHLLAEIEARPLAPANVLPEPEWNVRFQEAVRTVNNLRVGRASIDEALAALVAVGPARAF